MTLNKNIREELKLKLFSNVYFWTQPKNYFRFKNLINPHKKDRNSPNNALIIKVIIFIHG